MYRSAFVVLGLTVALTSVITTAGACKFAFPESCANVTCPSGTECAKDYNYWCPGRFGGIYTQVATCGNQDPCKGYRCPRGSQCVKVIDSCNDGICTMKVQCNEVVRPGSCPDPKDVAVHSCMNSCEKGSDAQCQAGAKCCSAVNFARKYCVGPIENQEHDSTDY